MTTNGNQSCLTNCNIIPPLHNYTTTTYLYFVQELMRIKGILGDYGTKHAYITGHCYL